MQFVFELRDTPSALCDNKAATRPAVTISAQIGRSLGQTPSRIHFFISQPLANHCKIRRSLFLSRDAVRGGRQYLVSPSRQTSLHSLASLSLFTKFSLVCFVCLQQKGLHWLRDVGKSDPRSDWQRPAEQVPFTDLGCCPMQICFGRREHQMGSFDRRQPVAPDRGLSSHTFVDRLSRNLCVIAFPCAETGRQA